MIVCGYCLEPKDNNGHCVNRLCVLNKSYNSTEDKK